MHLGALKSRVQGKVQRVYERVTPYMPPSISARVDHLIPAMRQPWGGPLNAQEKRQASFRAMFDAIDFDAIVETGTYRGTSTEFLRRASRKPVYTVELFPRFYEYSRIRFRDDPEVHLALDHSLKFLRRLKDDARLADATLFFYLDAHWQPPGQPLHEADLPLREEVHFILASWKNAVIAIDDFQVPDDPGYGFDECGPNARLTLEFLHLERVPPVKVFWPLASAAEETGAKRGSVVLAAEGPLANALAKVTTLRRLGTNGKDARTA